MISSELVQIEMRVYLSILGAFQLCAQATESLCCAINKTENTENIPIY